MFPFTAALNRNSLFMALSGRANSIGYVLLFGFSLVAFGIVIGGSGEWFAANLCSCSLLFDDDDAPFCTGYCGEEIYQTFIVNSIPVTGFGVDVFEAEQSLQAFSRAIDAIRKVAMSFLLSGTLLFMWICSSRIYVQMKDQNNHQNVANKERSGSVVLSISDS